MAKRNEYAPQTVTHPGITLREKLGEMGMSQKEFAVRTGKPEQTIVKVINGESSLTPDMAVQFESVLRIPATFWLKRQQLYDEVVARAKRSELLANASEWARKFPLKKMTEFGWLPKQRNPDELAGLLLDFFSMSSPEAWEGYYLSQKLKVDFRISLAHFSEPYAISSWLRQGELDSLELEAAPYDKKRFMAALPAIKQIMAEHPEDFFPQLQKMCRDAGVKVVYTPCLTKAPIHGSTRWLYDNTPLIQLSARYKQNDRFWFTFFHEAGHILLHGKKHISIECDQDEIEGDSKELEANDFAVFWTFSEEEEQEVLAKGLLDEQDIIEYARKFGTHPAMIIGRFHHKRILPFSVGRKFIRPIQLDRPTDGSVR